jgi:hypothetical protein
VGGDKHVDNGEPSKRISVPDRFAPTDGHNSPGIITAPITGTVTSGDGDNDRGRALRFGEESGSDFIVFMASRK